jgi:hypothetical protein
VAARSRGTQRSRARSARRDPSRRAAPVRHRSGRKHAGSLTSNSLQLVVSGFDRDLNRPSKSHP